MNENARVISGKDEELNKIQCEKSSMFDQFKDRLAMFMDENVRIISQKDEELNELKEEKCRSICQLKNQLAKLKKEFHHENRTVKGIRQG